IPVPSVVVTLIFPVSDVAWIVATIDVGVADVTAPGPLPNFTIGVAVPTWRLKPLTVTVLPVTPVPGVKSVIFGVTLKIAALRAGPAGFVTPNFPVAATSGITIRIIVADSTMKPGNGTSFNRTSVTEFRFVPVIVTVVPTGPLAGVKAVMVGGLMTVNVSALIPVPSVVVTLIFPVSDVAWIVATIDVGVADVTAPGPLPNFTIGVAVPTWRLKPLIVTVLPVTPVPGVKSVIFGVTLKATGLVPVPSGLVSCTRPVTAPAGTAAWTDVAVTIVAGTVWLRLNVTSVTVPRLRPMIVTTVPTGPLSGASVVIFGTDLTVTLTVPAWLKFWPSLTVTLTAHVFDAPVVFAGAVQVGACAVASSK